MKRQGVRILSLAALGLVLVATGVALVWLSHRSGRVVWRYEAAEREIAAKNWPIAKWHCQQLIAQDPNSERAYALMAKVAAEEGNPATEAYYTGLAMRLNEFKTEYVARYRNALLRLRDFRRYRNELEISSAAALSADDESWLVYAVYMTESAEAAGRKREAFLAQHGPTDPTPASRFVDDYLTLAGKPADVAAPVLAAHTNAPDAMVRLESHLLLASCLKVLGNVDAAGRVYAEALPLDYFAVAPMLARFYLSVGRIAAGVALNGEHLARFPNLRGAYQQADWMVAGGRVDLLAGLEKLFPAQDYNALVFLGYLDALRAFDRGDLAAVATALEPVRTAHVSPWSCMMAVLSDIPDAKEGRLDRLVVDLRQLVSMPPFFDCRERACSAVRDFIIRENAAGVPASKLASLAEIVSSAAKQPDAAMDLVVLRGGLQAGTLSRDRVQDLVGRHADHPAFLETLAEKALADADCALARTYARRLAAAGREASANSVLMRAAFVQADAARSAESRREASSALRTCLSGKHSRRDLETAWRYALAAGVAEDLTYLESLTASADAEAFRKSHADRMERRRIEAERQAEEARLKAQAQAELEAVRNRVREERAAENAAEKEAEKEAEK